VYAHDDPRGDDVRAALLLALLGCSPRPRTVAVDYSASSEERDAITRGIYHWNGILSFDSVLRYAEDPDVDIFIRIDDPRTGTDGVHRASLGTIVVRHGLEIGWFAAVIEHELGHALGLGHTRCGVMNGESDPAREFCAEDLRECAEVGACEEE
jgi:predicted Zn-dependent protease